VDETTVLLGSINPCVDRPPTAVIRSARREKGAQDRGYFFHERKGKGTGRLGKQNCPYDCGSGQRCWRHQRFPGTACRAEDDESLENKAIADAPKLIEQDRVLAIVGPTGSGAALKIKPICEAAKVPMVSCAASEAIVTPPENSRFTFMTSQMDTHAAVRIMEQIKVMGILKIGLLSDTMPFGQQGRKQLKTCAQNIRIDIVGDETYGPNDTNMTPALEKLKANGAGAIINWSFLPVQTIVAKNMKTLGMNLPLFHGTGFGQEHLKALGDAGEGIIFPQGRLLAVDLLPDDHYQKKVLLDYKKAYETKYKSPVSTFGGQAYDALWLVLNAIKAKRVTPDMPVELARQQIRDGLEDTKDWVGIAGTFNMSPTDHVGLDKYDAIEMIVVKKGGALAPFSGN
jgi:branched-chain amino acid transport system substrate-binding protein